MSQSTPPVLSQAPSSAASSPTWASWIWSWAWWWVPSSLAHAFLLLAVVTVCVAALIVYTESARKKRSARSSRDSLGPRRRVVTELTPPSITSPRPAHTPGPTLERPDNLRQRYPQLTQSLGSTHFGGEPRPTFAPPQSARPRPSDSRLPSYANNPLYQSHIDAANSFAFTPTRPLPKVEYRESVDPALLRLLEQQKHQRALAISSRSQRADQLDEPTPIPNRASTDRPAVQEQVGEERPRISRARSEAFDFEAPYDRMDDDDDRPQGFGSRRAKRRLVQEDSLDMDEMEQGDAIRRSRFGHERSNNLTEDGEEGPPKRRRHVLEIFAEERRQKKENRGDVTPLPKRLEKTGPGVSSVKRLRSSVVASKTPVRRREMAPVPTPKQGSSVSRSSSKRKQIALVDDSEDDQDLLALEQDMPPEDGWITPAAYMARRKRRKQIPSEEVKDAEVQTQATNGEDEPSTEPKVYYNPVPRVASVSTPRGRVRLHATPIKNLKEREMRITKMPTPFNRRGITSEEVDAMIRETMERDAEEDATTLPSAKKRVTFSLSQKAEAEPSPSKDTGGSGASQSETTNDPSSAAGPGLFAASKGLFTSAESSAPSTSAFSVGVTSSPPKGSDKTLFGSLNKSSGADSSTAPSGSSSVFQNLGPTPSFGSSSGLAKTSPVASSTASAVPSFNFAPKPENSSGATPAVVTANSSQEKQQEPAKDQVKESQGPTSTAPVFNFTSSTSAPLFAKRHAYLFPRGFRG
ncbi:hypothetical protein DFJ73DRAFT_592593 [Zopfochytrium polystomum]|nr:hypothetical protein DFJ73DRAFT_592593 [Zopfochytrium polystomum]